MARLVLPSKTIIVGPMSPETLPVRTNVILAPLYYV